LTGNGPDVLIQHATRERGIPDDPFLIRCVHRAFGDVAGEVVIRIVDEAESAMLNGRYRDKSGPTNVLSFSPDDELGDLPVADDEPAPLGDIVICAAVMAREAEAQGKPLEAHWAHIVIHGCLHLQDYDHMNDTEADGMETRERELLAGLGIADPYAAEA
jgi:probable rRNA maturation factor